MPYPDPPAIAGLSNPGPEHAALLIEWAQQSHRHAARVSKHSTPFERATARAQWRLYRLLRPLFVRAQRALFARPARRYYLSETAVLGIAVGRRGWTVVDHLSADPGKGLGRRLRDQVLPALRPLIMEHKIPLRATTSSKVLARQWAANFTQLGGTTRLRRRVFPPGYLITLDPATEAGTVEDQLHKDVER